MEEKVKKILVTGFTPFGLHSIPVPGWYGNRSQDVCLRLEKEPDLKSKIQVKIIQVTSLDWHLDHIGQLTNVGRTDFKAGLAEQPAGIFMLGELQGLKGFLTGVRIEPIAIKDKVTIGTLYTLDAASRAERSHIMPGKLSGLSGIGNTGCNELFGMAISHANKYTPVIPVEFLHCGFGLEFPDVCRIIKNELLRMINTAL